MSAKVVVALLIATTIYSVLAEEFTPEQKKECLKITKRTLKSMMKSFNTCNGELKLHHISGEEYQKKIGCVVKCVMKSVDALDENDMMTEETLKKNIEAQVPKEFVPFAHEKMMVCVKQHTLDPKDENCKSYLDMGTCMQSAVTEVFLEAYLRRAPDDVVTIGYLRSFLEQMDSLNTININQLQLTSTNTCDASSN